MGSQPLSHFSGQLPQRLSRNWLFTALLIGISFCLAGQASAISFEVTAQTMECSGDIGFTSFDSRDLYKIQPGECSDPNTGNKLQQVLLKSRGGLVNYEVLWVTQEEARNILTQITEIKNAKLERLTRPNIVIEKKSVIKQEAAPVVRAPVSATRGDQPGPEINVIDPPVSNTRSISNIITPAGVDSRLVVGRIDAPAGLLSLTINGQPQDVDEQGMFKAKVSVSQSKTPVKLVAVDKQGKQNSLEFRLLPEMLAESASTDTDASDTSIFGNYHALVIANNQYEKLDDLSTPINDADAISDVLKQRYGFSVTRLNNATRYEMLSALNKLRRELTEKDNLLLYYAGHGEYDKTNVRGHWLPIDAERDSSANWVSTVAITDIINAMSAKHVLVVADSCYSGALTRSASTELDPGMSDDLRAKWLRAIAKTRSRYVLTSGGVKPVLDDGGNGHSMFANALLNTLQENRGVLEGSKLYRDVKTRVQVRAEELRVEQSPQYAKLKRTGHEFGEFLLVGQQ